MEKSARVRFGGDAGGHPHNLPPSYLGCCQQGLGFQKIQVDRQQVEVFIVEQTVHSVKGIPNSCQFYLLSDG